MRKLLQERVADVKLLHPDERPEKFEPRSAVDLPVLPFGRQCLDVKGEHTLLYTR